MSASDDSGAHWRDSARPVKFFIWDGRSVFPVILFLMHMTWWTLVVTLLLMVFFSILNRFGFTPVVFGRWLRNVIAGNRKMAVPWWMS